MKNQTSTSIRRLCALALSLLLAFSTLCVAALADNSAAIAEDKNGVFLVRYCYPDTTGGSQGYTYFQLGSAFLVNETTLITCNHVVHISDSDALRIGDDVVSTRDFLEATYGKNWEKKMEIRVYYTNSNYYVAKEIPTIRNEQADYTALELSKPLVGHKILPLRSAEELNPTDSVYALGFPYTKVVYEDATKDKATSGDVNIESGNVSKLTDVGATRVINHSATLIGGMSGGPLVDSEGNVVGVNAFNFDGQENNYYSVSIDQVTNALTTTGTEFTKAGDPGNNGNDGNNDNGNGGGSESSSEEVVTPPTDFTALNSAISAKEAELSDTSKKYTEESVNTVKQAIEEAKVTAGNAAATQEEVNAAAQKVADAHLEEIPGPAIPMAAIIGIAVAVVVVIILIIVLVARGKGKEDDVEEYSAPSTQPSPQPYNGGFNQQPAQPVYSAPAAAATASPATDVLGGSSNETTVLSSGSNETTVLSSRPYGRLTRSSTNESVEVAAEHFLIGKERSKVSYCISNNGAISRTHAEITKSGGGISLIDKNSKNGTFLNGVKCESGRAVPLKDGDRITLADEEFRFNVL